MDLHFAKAFGLLVAVAGFASGCSQTTPKAEVADAEPVQERVDRGPTTAESDIGGMNEYEVDKTFATLEGPIMRCVKSRSSRVRELGGHFDISMRIDRQGHVVWAYLKQSTIGDRDTEKCVLDAAREKTWPKPLGGEGLAVRAFDIDPSSEPATLDEKQSKGVARHVARKVAKCRTGVNGQFVATAYVRPDGRVLTAGVAPPSAESEDAADCVAEAIERLTFGSPGKKLAKVTFSIP